MSDYGASGEKNTGLNYYGQAGSDYNTLGNVGNQNFSYYGQDNSAYRNAEQGVASQLLRNPTSQDRAQYLAGANGGAMDTYLRAKARATQDAANRGLDTANSQGSESSVLGGTLGALDNGLASTQAGNASNYYNEYQSPNALLRRQQAAAGIYGDLANTEYGRGFQGVSAAAQGRMGLGGAYLSQSARDYARSDANNPWKSIAGLAGTAASIYGMTRGGGGQPAQAGGSSYGGDPDAFMNTYQGQYGGYGNTNPLMGGYDATGAPVANMFGPDSTDWRDPFQNSVAGSTPYYGGGDVS